MTITPLNVTVRDLIEGYENNESPYEDVTAYGGRLNIRPAFQREFIYDEDSQKAVINTVRRDFPLSTMYWVLNDDGTYGVLDGQQRSLSICEFMEGKYFINFNGSDVNIHCIRRNHPDLYEKIMNYSLDVRVCKGTKEEQLDWFTTINIAGKALSEQELRNINYTGPWLTSAKKYFCKPNAPVVQIAMAKGSSYLDVKYDRQEALELALRWITDSRDKNDMSKVCQYMGNHQEDADASELWEYFSAVIDWVKELFPNYRKEMKGIQWGFLYNDFHENEYDPDELEEMIERLYGDEDVTSCKGIYKYVLDGNETHLSIRKFNDKIKHVVYARQQGICPICGEHFVITKMEADHIVPWVKGGKTVESNCQMLCRACNRDKSSSMPTERN